jgi:hypothetical protein
VSHGGSITATVEFNTDEQGISVFMADFSGGMDGGTITLTSATHATEGNVTAQVPDATSAGEIYSVLQAAMAALDADGTADAVTFVFNVTVSCPTAIGAFRIQAIQDTSVLSNTITCNPTTATPTVTGTPATATPTVTGTPGAAAQITVSAAPTSIGCQGSTFITAVVKTATGANVPDGTQVQLSTTIGTITPATATTVGGGILAVLTAPANQSGSATVRAQVGAVTGETVVQITCAQATNTPVPPAATLPPTGIQPPATGDAGLADGNARTYLGIAMLAVSVLGGLAAVRKRSEA